MKFINNYSRQVTLAQGAQSLALDLPPGTYRLTLADALTGRWEIVDAVVAGGTAALTRGMEGTADQAWPQGSTLYCAVTAGQLTQLFAAVADLTARVAELEGGGGGPVGALTDAQNNPLTDGAGNFLTGA